jgi:hypothetical protein
MARKPDADGGLGRMIVGPAYPDAVSGILERSGSDERDQRR